MIIKSPHLCTKIDIWSPKYSGKDGWRVLIAKYKVHHGSGILLINFTKAKHLKGQRFAITRDAVQRCDIVGNGKIACYSVPFDLFENYETAEEVRETAFSVFSN